MITFAWPYLFFLLPLPYIVYRFFKGRTFYESAPLKVPDLDDFTGFQQAGVFSIPKKNLVLASLIWLSLVTAAARPQWVGEMVALPQAGRDLLLAVDLSGSMQTQDFESNGKMVDRLTALKMIMSDFIERRKGDRIGLVLFGSQAYIQTPLTFDLATVKQLLMESAIGLAGNETAIGDAIGLSVKQLRNSPAASRVLILLTDGNSNAGELKPEKAAEIAARENLKIYTVAIGSKEMLVQTIFGSHLVNPSSELDEETLKMVAEKTNGSYFRAYNMQELSQIYEQIDQLEKIDRSNSYWRPIEEIYFWPLVVALIGICIAVGSRII